MTRLHPPHAPIAAKLQEILRTSGLEELPDSQLLHRFSHYADHAAFEVLLRKHGPMVLGVCRRVLANGADAEDAFQATFLILVRKARSVRRGDRLGPWLYGVAYRVARKARARAGRLSVRHNEVTDMFPDPAGPVEVPDWMPVLDTELNALPARYRDPLLLCELQGATRAEAARVLKIPEGTLSSRLARGRELLRKRLLKHGTLLPAGGLAALLVNTGIGRAIVNSSLFTRTAEPARLLATGSKTAGVVPVETAVLMDEVMKGMFLVKLRVAGGAILAAVLVAAGLVAAAPAEPPAPAQKPKVTSKEGSSVTPTAPGEKPMPARTKPDSEALQGLWVVEEVQANKNHDRAEVNEFVGERLLFVGEVCWAWKPGDVAGSPTRLQAKFDPSKNPKWLDLVEFQDPPVRRTTRCIYEIEGDKLRFCLVMGENNSRRPAELNAEDEDVAVLKLSRERPPPPAGVKALTGSWGDSEVEILDGFLFVRVSKAGADSNKTSFQWVGGSFTVDVTKNPKWIDVELVRPYPDAKTTKLYGTYELTDGKLKMALGLTGKRAFRPLEFKEDKDVLFFEVEKNQPETYSGGMTLPPPGHLNHPPQYFPAEPDTKLGPKSGRPDAPSANTQGRFGSFPLFGLKDFNLKDEPDYLRLIKEGKFAEAAAEIRKEAPTAKAKFFLVVCLIQLAQCNPPEATKHLTESLSLATHLVEDLKKADERSDEAIWILIQTENRILQILYLSGKTNELITKAQKIADSSGETLDGMIARSFLYHGYVIKGEKEKARDTWERMKVHYERLPDSAFTARSGEYSRAYWETCFGEDALKKR